MILYRITAVHSSMPFLILHVISKFLSAISRTALGSSTFRQVHISRSTEIGTVQTKLAPPPFPCIVYSASFHFG